MIQIDYQSYNIHICCEANQLDRAAWDAIVPDFAIMSKSNFLEVCEKYHRDHLTYFFCSVKKNEKTIAVFYLHKVLFRGEILSNYFLKSRGNTLKGLVNNIIDKLRFGFLSTGNIIASNEPCFYTTEEIPEQARFAIFEEAVAAICQHMPQENIMGHYIHCNFGDPGNLPESRNYIKVDVEPDMCLDLPPTIHTYEDYNDSIKSKYKKRNRKIYKDSEALHTKILSEKEILQYGTTLYELYLNISKQANFNVLQLHPNYFIHMKQKLGDTFEIEAYYLEDKMVGFSSRLFNGTKAWIHFIGLDYQYSQQYHTYNRMLLDNLKRCIEKGIHCISYGRTATEIKSTLGAQAYYSPSYIKHHNCLIQEILKRYFRDKEVAPVLIRQPFKQQTAPPKVVLTES